MAALLRLAKSGSTHRCGGLKRCDGAVLLDVDAALAAAAAMPVLLEFAAPQVHLHVARRRRGEVEAMTAEDRSHGVLCYACMLVVEW